MNAKERLALTIASLRASGLDQNQIIAGVGEWIDTANRSNRKRTELLGVHGATASTSSLSSRDYVSAEELAELEEALGPLLDDTLKGFSSKLREGN